MKEVDAEQEGTRPGEFERDRQRTIELMRAFAAPDASCAAFIPIFGEMSRAEWMKWGLGTWIIIFGSSAASRREGVMPIHQEMHHSARVGWLRAAVLGANDGLISTSSLIVGVVSALLATRHDVLLAGLAGTVAGALSMAAGEYVKRELAIRHRSGRHRARASRAAG